MAESFPLECPVIDRCAIDIRCETGIAKGLGHISRSMTLGKALQKRCGATVRFLCDPNPPVEELLRREHWNFVTNDKARPEEEFLRQETAQADIVIVDRQWDYSAEFVRGLGRSRKIVFIDHCSPGSFEADLTIFPTASVTAEIVDDVRWRNRPDVFLYGAEFILMSERVIALRNRRRARCQTGRPIILTTGGCDPEAVMIQVLPWLGRVTIDGEVEALIGDAFAHHRQLEALKPTLPSHIQFYPFDAGRLPDAGIAICTFGVSVYELMFLGVPTLVIGHSLENADASRVLAERCGATIDLGYIGELTEDRFTQALTALLNNPKKQNEISRRALEQVDGLGAQRVAERIAALAA